MDRLYINYDLYSKFINLRTITFLKRKQFRRQKRCSENIQDVFAH